MPSSPHSTPSFKMENYVDKEEFPNMVRSIGIDIG